MVKEIECKIFGLVQGVFFRNFAKEKAVELGITGFAQNLSDGTVGVVGQGSENALRKFVEFLSAGPKGAEVESMNVNWNKEIKEYYSEFKII